MGTSAQGNNSNADNFTHTKSRIDKAFERLREEMKEIQRQDIDLLTQLMHIRHTILLLCQSGDRRSYSIDALDPDANDVIKSDMTSFARRRALTRVQSAPLESAVSEDVIFEDDEEDFDDDDDLLVTQSLDASVLGSRFHHTVPDDVGFDCANRHSYYVAPDIVYALGPLPPVLKRLMMSSSAPGSPVPRRACSEEMTPAQIMPSLLPVSQQPCMVNTPKDNSAPATNRHDCRTTSFATKRPRLTRQRSVDDRYDQAGKLVMENLRRTQSMKSSPLGVQV